MQSLPATRHPQMNRLAVYVYDLPAWLAQQLHIDRGCCNDDSIYSAYVPFMEELLRSTGAVRTLDPYEANFCAYPLRPRSRRCGVRRLG
jgi:hypothetical protein